MKVVLIVQKGRDGDGVKGDLDNAQDTPRGAKQVDNEGVLIARKNSDFRGVYRW